MERKELIPTIRPQKTLISNYDSVKVFNKFCNHAKLLCTNPEYKIIEENLPVIEMLILYICNDPAFEQLPVSNHLRTQPSLSKGICLMGNSGSGKTLIMQILSRIKMPGNIFEIVFTDMILQEYKKQDDYLMQKYYKEFIDKDRTRPKEICFDEFGYEQQFKDFGSQVPFYLDIIVKRNRSWVSHGIKTHFTTNFNRKKVEEYYGYRSLRRIEEMCNIINLGTGEVYTDWRKDFATAK